MIRPTDPEGLFSTLTAIFNAYMGLYYSYLFMRYKQDKKKLFIYWLCLSLGLMVAGYWMKIGMPFNKKIWSVSFAFETSGISGLALSICFFILDLLNYPIIKKLLEFCIWLGMNPLFVFVGMIFLDNILMNDVFIVY